ncbi:type II toxin-antitoxin system death-on-curing family toxin [Kyrpidia spormannii]|uniref:Type II toxin-antitoxin system death-on-curing family toxin n=1 Tax=Kyrpidia spormannii TaxID=2055160 RepID=A0A2K8N6R6_9BACL|nr:type II toxin-antitoxin system death-on-curing family toxin [Kyrpidia spormannii]ATY84507.1 type II toxin-antitoxin system death-on-curing family toxin [Kyrpidia spormannii]
MNINHLTAEDIREIHVEALRLYGGTPGEHEPGSIELMAEKPAMELFGHEQYPGLFLKAAVYFEGFATRQFFVDGNKRTAYLCAATFLRLNGYCIIVSDDELYHFSLDVANKKVNLDDIARWLETHSEPCSNPLPDE